MSKLIQGKANRFSIDSVSAGANRPRRWRLALLLRVRIYNGDGSKPKIRFSIPLPLLFCLSIPLDLLTCIVLSLAFVVSFFLPKREHMPLIRGIIGAIARGFFLTRVSFMLMCHGGRLRICAIDGDSGVIIYGT